MPRHPPSIQNRQPITCIIGNILEIHDPRVVVILAGEEGGREGGGMDVGERVSAGVPPPETKVKSANAGEVVVDYDDLWKVGLM
jgi:hypothetical protein